MKLEISIKTPQALAERYQQITEIVDAAGLVVTECWAQVNKEWLEGGDNTRDVYVSLSDSLSEFLKDQQIVETVVFIFADHGWVTVFDKQNCDFEFRLPKGGEKVPSCSIPEGRRNWKIPQIVSPDRLTELRNQHQVDIAIAENVASIISTVLEEQWKPDSDEPIAVEYQSDEMSPNAVTYLVNCFSESGWKVVYDSKTRKLLVSPLSND